MPLFGKSSKSPSDVVRNLKDALLTLEKGGQDAKKQEKVWYLRPNFENLHCLKRVKEKLCSLGPGRSFKTVAEYEEFVIWDGFQYRRCSGSFFVEYRKQPIGYCSGPAEPGKIMQSQFV